MEDLLYEAESVRRFVGLRLSEAPPGGVTGRSAPKSAPGPPPATLQGHNGPDGSNIRGLKIPENGQRAGFFRKTAPVNTIRF